MSPGKKKVNRTAAQAVMSLYGQHGVFNLNKPPIRFKRINFRTLDKQKQDQQRKKK